MLSTPRVVHVVPALFGPTGIVGGAERYAFELARAMADAVPTTLVTFGDAAREETVGRLRVRVLGPAWHVRGQSTNPLARGIANALLAGDVIHCHQQHIVVSSLAAVLGRLTGRRVFVTDLGGGGWDVSAYIRTDRWYTGHLHISAYSLAVAGHAARRWARVILGGVDTARFAPDAAVPRGNAALFVGRLLPHKGVDDLIRAASDDLEVTIVGPAPDARFLRDLHALAEGKAIRFHHDFDDGALVEAYRRAACVVLPSVYRNCYGGETLVPELLGQTLLEGMACGAPAIATRVASLPEVVDHGRTGFLVPPNDPPALREQLLWIRDHPQEAAAMGEAARARVLERFTWDRVVECCLDAYGGATRWPAPAPSDAAPGPDLAPARAAPTVNQAHSSRSTMPCASPS